MSDVNGWTPQVTELMSEAGWQPGRKVDIDGWATDIAENSSIHMHEAAARFLREFGGLHVPDGPDGGPGQQVATVEFVIDPSHAGRRRRWFDSLDVGAVGELYPIGDTGGGRTILAMDEAGMLFSLFGDDGSRVGVGREAIANLVIGRRLS